MALLVLRTPSELEEPQSQLSLSLRNRRRRSSLSSARVRPRRSCFLPGNVRKNVRKGSLAIDVGIIELTQQVRYRRRTTIALVAVRLYALEGRVSRDNLEPVCTRRCRQAGTPPVTGFALHVFRCVTGWRRAR